MSLMAVALQPHTIQGFNSLSGRVGPLSLSDLIVDQRSSYDLDFDDTEKSISIDFRDPNVVVPALALDCSRFAVAAFQSIAPVSKEILDKDTLAWSMVKMYYAAFYAGHSIIRLLGESCSFLERVHTNRISSLGVAIGRSPSFQIDRGMYHGSLNSASSAVKYVRTQGGAVGGAHESFWSMFHQRINRLSQSVLTGYMEPREAQLVFSKFNSFEKTLKAIAPGMHYPLSFIRNDFQYKHLHGIWFPVETQKRKREALGRLAEQWQRDPMEIDVPPARQETLDGFVAACTFIVGLCRSLLLRIAERSSAGPRCFLCFGPLSFLRDAGLKT